MSNNKSSVEWLQWALEHTILSHEQVMQSIGLFEQAKAMHKDEIIDAVQSCGYIGGATDEEAENYYNETFNTK
jgi:disulfide oxidoreductase YuzD